MGWQHGWMLKTRATESRVSVGTATVAMILNGLGESLRQLYLVPQYFANKPIEQRYGGRVQGRDARVSTAWDARWIGCTRTIRRSCLLGLPAEHARSLGSKPSRSMLIPVMATLVIRSKNTLSRRIEHFPFACNRRKAKLKSGVVTLFSCSTDDNLT